ncbi:MAG TPA: hypothetical protein VFA47_09965 [Candidatus Manganitrophaceae bacterium]|nr:hypothetical protein [Candidatus Manganitrophaceae bacterium]
MNAVELAWRSFRKNHAHDLAEVLALKQDYYSFIGLQKPPTEVSLPIAVCWNLLSLREAQARGEGPNGKLSPMGQVLAGSLSCWAAYREAKTFYRVDSYLVECLSKTKWPDHVPTEALRLPSRCPILSFSWNGETENIAIHYDLRTNHEPSGQLELRIYRLDQEHWLPISILHLVEDTLQECIRSAGMSVMVQMDASINPLVFRSPIAGLVLTILLYLAGEPDLVRMVHPGERPEKEAKMRRSDPERWRDLHSPTSYDVGGSFRAAIERWEVEHLNKDGSGAGKSVRPHLRRAHAHLFWTGEKRGIPKVKFLMPISVKGGKLVEEAEGPSEQAIR